MSTKPWHSSENLEIIHESCIPKRCWAGTRWGLEGPNWYCWLCLWMPEGNLICPFYLPAVCWPVKQGYNTPLQSAVSFVNKKKYHISDLLAETSSSQSRSHFSKYLFKNHEATGYSYAVQTHGPTLLKIFISSIQLECRDYHPI